MRLTWQPNVPACVHDPRRHSARVSARQHHSAGRVRKAIDGSTRLPAEKSASAPLVHACFSSALCSPAAASRRPPGLCRSPTEPTDMSVIGIDVGYDTAGARAHSSAAAFSRHLQAPGCRACVPDSPSAPRQSWPLRVAAASTCWQTRCPSGPLRELLRPRTQLGCGLLRLRGHGSTLSPQLRAGAWWASPTRSGSTARPH